MNLLEVYRKLLDGFGPQGWWPVQFCFSPGEWEICIGAILTQNTNWNNVERALENLKKNNIVTLEDFIKINIKKLENLIKPSGFYKQKAKRLREFAKFVLGFGSVENFLKKVGREELLKVKGIGPETCDSILLYAGNRPYFVIDSYTKRLVKKLGIETKMDYESLRKLFENRLPKDVNLYKEFHALIVEWGKGKNSSF